jgi:hypothetical protein
MPGSNAARRSVYNSLFSFAEGNFSAADGASVAGVSDVKRGLSSPGRMMDLLR